MNMIYAALLSTTLLGNIHNAESQVAYPHFVPQCTYVHDGPWTNYGLGVSCPYFNTFTGTTQYGPVVPQDVYYNNLGIYKDNTQVFESNSLQYRHDYENFVLDQQRNYYMYSPWGVPPGYQWYFDSQKEWTKYHQTIQKNQLDYIQGQQNQWFGRNKDFAEKNDSP